MTQLDRILDLLPAPYAVARDSALAQLLDAFALELEALQEDVERLRRTHWVRLAYRLEDLEKISDLVGVDRLPWESPAVFVERLLATVRARLAGALGPNEIKRFVHEYLAAAEKELDSTFVPGLKQARDAGAAFTVDVKRPLFRPLVFRENPTIARRSATLRARGGRVPYLFRWQESNRGLSETVADFDVTGLSGGRTAVPILANLTTGDLIGYSGTLRTGQTLAIGAAGDEAAPRRARATIGERDVTGSLFGLSGFTPGIPFGRDDLDVVPLVPRLARGVNEWVYLSVGLFDVNGLNRYFYAIAGEGLREGVFDETFFDRALFPAGPVAGLDMRWSEEEPASFEVRVPRYLVIEPAAAAGAAVGRPHALVAEALGLALAELHAAGVRARVHLDPFREEQRVRVRVRLPWLVLDREIGSAGERDRLSLGARYGESGLDESRFE